MKTIESVSIWSNGQNQQATVLNTYAVNVVLDKTATFWYGLYSQTEDGSIQELINQGNVSMSEEDYALWQSDEIAWAFVANKLKLVITGDYNS